MATADPNILCSIEDLVLTECPDAEVVILFGSRATGTAKPDSDYDVLIVVPENGEYTPEETQDFLYERSRVPAQIDLTVTTLAEIMADPSSIACTAYRDGTVLYGERQSLQSSTPTCG